MKIYMMSRAKTLEKTPSWRLLKLKSEGMNACTRKWTI